MPDETEMTHTPGTWRTWQSGEDPLINEECVLAEVTDRDEPLLVAEMNRTANEMTDFPGHWKANARLIAAAPDLLEAAKAAKSLIDELHLTPDERQIWKQLKDSIEKATE